MTSTPSTQSPSPTRGRISRPCSTNSGSGRWPRSTTQTPRWRSSRGARRWLRRRGRGRNSSGHAVARLHGLARSDLVLGGDGPAPRVFRTEVMCQNVPSLDEPVSPWRGPPTRTRPNHQGHRAPSLIMSRITGSPSVCVTQCRGFDSLEPPGKSNRLRSRDRLDLIVA